MNGTKYLFTLNNYTPEEVDFLKSDDEYKYIIFGYEQGESGTPHLQGYIQFKSNKRITGLKKYLSRAHWEKQKGTNEQARDYSTKDGEFFERGTFTKGRGQRSDLQEAVQTCLKRGYEAVAEEHPETFIKFHKGLSEYSKIVQPKRSEPPFVLWIYGPAGIGKTKFGYDLSNKFTVWIDSNDGKGWFYAYENQDIAIFDDYDHDNQFSFRFLLRLLDRYPLSVPVKGSHREWNSKIIIITSEFPPSTIYNSEYSCGSNGATQLNRRINYIGTKNALQEKIIFKKPCDDEVATEEEVCAEISALQVTIEPGT